MQVVPICHQKTRRGDTIVETMFAFAIFGLIAVINIQIMQRGTRLNQAALEVSLAREQMTAQAEALRLANSAYVSEYINNLSLGGAHASGLASDLWGKITGSKVAPLSIKSLSKVAEDGCKAPTKAFVLDFRSKDSKGLPQLPQIKTWALRPSTLYPRVVYENATDTSDIEKNVDYVYESADGIWIEAFEGGDAKTGKYYDFLIRACWDSPASHVPTTLETMVRLYVPS